MAAGANVPAALAWNNWQLARAVLRTQREQNYFDLPVLACSGDTVCIVHVCPLWSVSQLKFAIEDETQILALRQQLLVGASVLTDTDYLSDVLPSKDADKVVTLVQVGQVCPNIAVEAFVRILGGIRRRAAERDQEFHLNRKER
eukprot:TRINITY_DN77052_c0_g1_i1.p1 TRINITY_DN77052_c0_g1~~TRINITY_DN77052_c0_g1_i1.p1  ORF type:complete len:144 (+),score=21.43 TRINITY_DN77052_c0_g1_i1:105-536(+)